MPFTSYAAIRTAVLNNLADRNVDSFWFLSTENAREMKTVYTRLGNMTDFLEWLDARVGYEEAGYNTGAILDSVGGA